MIIKNDKHLVYAEDILSTILNCCSDTLSKQTICDIINKVIFEQEATIDKLIPNTGWSDIDNDGDIYD